MNLPRGSASSWRSRRLLLGLEALLRSESQWSLRSRQSLTGQCQGCHCFVPGSSLLRGRCGCDDCLGVAGAVVLGSSPDYCPSEDLDLII